MRNKRNEHFQPVASNIWVPERGTFTLRAEDPMRVYVSRYDDFAEEILIGLGVGEIKVDVPPRHFIRFETPGRVWMLTTPLNQSVEGSDETFATLDRPDPVSPEMRLIQQMMMKNQRERDADRAEMQRLRNERLELLSDREPSPRDTAKKAGKVRGAKKPSEADAKEPQGEPDSQAIGSAQSDAEGRSGINDPQAGDA